MVTTALKVRGIVGSIGAIAGAVLVGGAAHAEAQPPSPPPNCTAADLAGVMSGVAAATSAYKFTHPDVNWYFTSLRAQPTDRIRSQVKDYLNQNPQVKADLAAIRRPLADTGNRCG